MSNYNAGAVSPLKGAGGYEKRDNETVSSEMTGVRHEVLNDFQGEGEGEMTVKAGEIVIVHPSDSENDTQDGWILAEKLNEPLSIGYVPASWLKKIDPSPSFSAHPKSPPKSMYEKPTDVGNQVRSILNGNEENEREESHLRRISDPRLSTHLLGLLDPLALSGIEEEKAALQKAMVSNGIPLPPQLSGKKGMIQNDCGALKGLVDIVKKHKTPALHAAILSEDYGELHRRNNEYYGKITNYNNEAFRNLSQALADLVKKLNSNKANNEALMNKLKGMDDLIDEERRKWKQQNDADLQANSLLSKEMRTQSKKGITGA